MCLCQNFRKGAGSSFPLGLIPWTCIYCSIRICWCQVCASESAQQGGQSKGLSLTDLGWNPNSASTSCVNLGSPFIPPDLSLPCLLSEVIIIMSMDEVNVRIKWDSSLIQSTVPDRILDTQEILLVTQEISYASEISVIHLEGCFQE